MPLVNTVDARSTNQLETAIAASLGRMSDRQRSNFIRAVENWAQEQLDRHRKGLNNSDLVYIRPFDIRLGARGGLTWGLVPNDNLISIQLRFEANQRGNRLVTLSYGDTELHKYVSRPSIFTLDGWEPPHLSKPFGKYVFIEDLLKALDAPTPSA